MMFRLILRMGRFGFAGAVALVLSAAAVFGQVRTPVSGLSVEAGAGVKQTESNHGIFDFGRASALDKTEVKQTFRIRNDGKTALRQLRLAPSCGCVAAIFEGDSALANLEPGEEARAIVTVTVTNLPPGTLHKYVFVNAGDTPQPAAVLEITGQLAPVAAFSPNALDFGKVRAGEEHSLPFSLSIDRRLLDSGKPPRLVCPVPGGEIAEATDGDAKAVTPEGMRTFSYRLTLGRNAPLGFLRDRISFQLPAGKADGSGPGAALLTLTRYTLPVVGKILGDLSARPESLAFGSAPAGVETKREIVLTEERAGALSGARVMCRDSWMTARILPAGDGDAPRMLEVSIRPQTLGVFQSEITVTTANGQRLIIPVTVYVVPAAKTSWKP